MIHLYSAEALAGLMVICTLSVAFLLLPHLGVFWWRTLSTVEVLTLLLGSVCACRWVARGRTCQWPAGVDFTGRVALVTGATSGVGYAVATELALHGWTVLLTGRHADRVGRAAETIRQQVVRRGAKGCVVVMGEMDLSVHASIQTFAEALLTSEKRYPLSLLINAAGVLRRRLHYCASCPTWNTVEEMLATNALGPLMLTRLLLPRLEETARIIGRPSRIVNVASSCHTYLGLGRPSRWDPVRLIRGLEPRREDGAGGEGAGRQARAAPQVPTDGPRVFPGSSFVGYYGLSKLCVVWNTTLLARWVTGGTCASKSHASPDRPGAIVVAACHPGISTTHLYRELFPTWVLDYVLYYPSLLIGKTWFEAAQSTLVAAVQAEDVVQGGYYLCGGEHGPSSGRNCLSSHAQDEGAMQGYVEWLAEKLCDGDTPFLPPVVGA